MSFSQTSSFADLVSLIDLLIAISDFMIWLSHQILYQSQSFHLSLPFAPSLSLPGLKFLSFVGLTLFQLHLDYFELENPGR